MHSQHIQKLACLSASISKISGSTDVEDHIDVTCECLLSIHKGKPNEKHFLSTAHLDLFFEYLSPLPKFTKPLLRYRRHYEAFQEFVKKVAGDDDPVTITSFLKSQFPTLGTRELSWGSIFVQLEQLPGNRSSRSYLLKMKKLLDKFTNDEAVAFFRKM